MNLHLLTNLSLAAGLTPAVSSGSTLPNRSPSHPGFRHHIVDQLRSGETFRIKFDGSCLIVDEHGRVTAIGYRNHKIRQFEYDSQGNLSAVTSYNDSDRTFSFENSRLYKDCHGIWQIQDIANPQTPAEESPYLTHSSCDIHPDGTMVLEVGPFRPKLRIDTDGNFYMVDSAGRILAALSQRRNGREWINATTPELPQPR